MQKKAWIFVVVGTLGLSACLDTDLERGLAGAAAGAVVAGAVGVDPLTGALIGGTGGVVCDDVGICR